MWYNMVPHQLVPLGTTQSDINIQLEVIGGYHTISYQSFCTVFANITKSYVNYPHIYIVRSYSMRVPVAIQLYRLLQIQVW